MKHEKLKKLDQRDAEVILKSSSGKDLIMALLGISHLSDWKWVQNTYLKYLTHHDTWVASAAITGLGHLVRISGKIEKDRVIKHLNQITNTDLLGKVEDTLSDIQIFYQEDV